jgi:polyisoprenoid-binding protein YceI
MSTTLPTELQTLPNDLTAGTWAIDPIHSSAAFTVRHAHVSRVHGTVRITDGQIVVGKDFAECSARAALDPASVDTGSGARDDHLRSKDFFGVEEYPVWTFVSTDVGADGRGFYMNGLLTMRGVTQPILLRVDYHGVGDDSAGNTIAGFTATGEFSRRAFGMVWNGKSKLGNHIAGDTVTVTIEVTAVLQR